MTKQKKIELRAGLLTGGRDRHYSHGLASALAASGVQLDFIGSDELESAELRESPWINFLNLRGAQGGKAGLPGKMLRVLVYYFRLLVYAITARPKIFHILWNNKFELIDRTLLMAFYKLLGKKIVFTAHNVNAGARDGYDSFLNRATLKFQYRLCDQIFVHTGKMKNELMSDFAVPEKKIKQIPFGVNNAVPATSLTGAQARQQLGLEGDNKVILFFGSIAPYKGLEFLVEAFEAVLQEHPSARLIIAGWARGPKNYWGAIEATIASKPWSARVLKKIEYIPDPDLEVYFKAADALVLPYVHIFQSGVLFLAYSFGLPAIAADVGSLKEEIVEGQTGFICEPKNPGALARSICAYFQSDLCRELESRRREIKNFAREKYSWNKIAAITAKNYAELLRDNKNGTSLFKTKYDGTFSFDSHSRL